MERCVYAFLDIVNGAVDVVPICSFLEVAPMVAAAVDVPSLLRIVYAVYSQLEVPFLSFPFLSFLFFSLLSIYYFISINTNRLVNL